MKIDFNKITKEEAISYCFLHENDYIRDFDSIPEGIRNFDCLMEILKSGTIKPSELPDYGMNFEHF